MAIDLSGLDDLIEESATLPMPSGEPLRLRLEDVLEDPNQPRKEFPQESMDEMVASVKERGVKTPISVKPHPTLPGKYLLNYGARRYRASVALGLESIPAIIDSDHNDYDQVIENLQRENLTALELATFIQRKIKDGEKPGTIAKKLGKKPSMVSEHMALIDAPQFLMDLYLSGRCTSARTLYDLRSLNDKHPEAVAEFVRDNPGEIERKKVVELAAVLKGGNKPTPAPPAFRHDEKTEQPQAASGGQSAPNAAAENPATATASFRHDEKTETEQGTQDGGGSSNGRSEEADGAPVQKILPHNTANEKALNKPAGKDDGSRLKKPVMIVEYDGRAAMVLIFNRPTASGLLWIKYEDNGEEVQVDAGQCKINNLQDAAS